MSLDRLIGLRLRDVGYICVCFAPTDYMEVNPVISSMRDGGKSSLLVGTVAASEQGSSHTLS